MGGVEMRHLSFTLATAGAAFAACLGIAAPASAETNLTISSWLPPQHAVTRALTDWGKEVETATSGRVKFQLLAKAVTAPAGTFDAVRDGLADISWSLDGYTPGRFVAARAGDFPLLGDTSESNSVAYQRIYDRYLAKADEHKGTKVMAVFLQGPSSISTTKKPVRALSDLEGMKMRIGGGLLADLTKLLGVNALLKPVTEAYELLSTGVADGLFSASEGIASFKLDRVIKYNTRVPGGMYNNSFAVLMNPDSYKKIPEQDRKIIDGMMGEPLARRLGKYWDEADKVGDEAMKTAGVEFIHADAAFVEGLRAKSKILEEEWFKAVAAKGVDGPKALADLRAEIKKAAASAK
jgi:TRAP-type C4-dicarboxylate transport system substrate-binding protein